MGFTEETFLFIFLPVTLLLYLGISKLRMPKLNNIMLVVFSLLFYAWADINTLILFLSLCFIAYFFGCIIEASKRNEINMSKKWLIAAVILAVGYLSLSKFSAFVVNSINQWMILGLEFETIAAPIGISFVIFEAISYVVDIYRGLATPGHVLDVLVFFSLFPKIVSGPIVLWRDFQPQLANRENTLNDTVNGIDRIIIGLAKKAILADTFGFQIQQIQSQTLASGMDRWTMWLMAILYFFQLYYDFSGYSDIAIGLCRVFGFHVSENFNFPYVSASVSEFWRRWHISLGRWFREYVYIPLGGNRRGNVYVNLFVVFLLTGIWHGSNWTFLIWGGINGLAVVLERLIRNKNWYNKIPKFIKWTATMVFVFFAWILFMSKDLSGALENYTRLFVNAPGEINFTWRYFLTNKILFSLAIAGIGAIIGFLPLEKIKQKFSVPAMTLLYRIALLALLVIDILFVVNSSYSPFLYFQF